MNKYIEKRNYMILFFYRENNQVLGAFLFINKIQETDYGQYMCSISNTDDQILQQFINITKPSEFILQIFFARPFIFYLIFIIIK